MSESAAQEFKVELSERLDIASAEALHLSLEDALASGQEVKLMGADVVKLDTAGVQVLSAFCEEANKLHLKVDWIKPSDTISQVFTFLGLTEMVGLNVQELKDD